MNRIVNNKVVIWGPDDFNTLGLLRQLGSAGIYGHENEMYNVGLNLKEFECL